jgi:PST family polysaccharide transporter
MVLARLLAKEDFGLMAIIFVSYQMLQALTEAGVKPSIIQNKEGGEPAYLNVAWWFQAVRTLSLFVIAYACAPWICNFYNTPDLLGWLRFSFLAIVFNGLLSPRVHALEKNFRFGRAALIIQGGSFIGIVLTIILAFILRNVSALVIGFTAEPALRTLLSYILCPFRPSLKIDREKLKSLLTFARGVIGLPILTCIAFQTDVLVLGKMVTKAELGMYYLTLAFMQLPIGLFQNVIGGFLLPAFAEKQDDKQKLNKGVREITRNISLLCIPSIAFLCVCASQVLSVVYGAAYSAAAIPFALLSGYVLIRMQSHILGTVFLAIGKPHIQRACSAVRAAIIVALMYPGVLFFGLSGATAVVLLGNFVAICFQTLRARRVIQLKFNSYIRCYVPGLLLALPVIMIVGLLRLSGVNSPVWILTGGALALATAFIGGVFTLNYHKPSAI